MVKREIKSEPEDSTEDEVPLSATSKTKKRRTFTTNESSAGDEQQADKNDEGDEFIKLGKDTLRVTVREYNGQTLIDIRHFYKDKATGEIKPGRKGISLSREQWNLLKDNMDVIEGMISKV